MLKRISKIQGIGTYANCTAGQAEFRKISLIFGYNSHGKSTLTQIFRSIEINNVDEVKSRLTIPDGISQSVCLSMSLDEKEFRHDFNGTEWTKTTHNFKWKVFDSGFISRNVISGENIERSNKENLSKFVLGEEGVQKSNEIASLKQELRKIKSEQKKNLEQLSSLAGPDDVRVFVNLKSEKSKEDALIAYNQAVSKASAIRESIANITHLKSRPVLKKFSYSVSFFSVLDKIQIELGVTLADVHGAARIRLEEHVKNHMTAGPGHRDWISHGVDFQKEDECPFCEQKLSVNAKELIRAYQSAFDDDFIYRSNALKRSLDNLEQALFRHNHFDLSADEINYNIILLYTEVSNLEPYSTLASRLSSFKDDLKEEITNFFAQASVHTEDARLAIQEKRSSLFEIFTIKDFSALRNIEFRIRERMKYYNETVDEFNQLIETYKFGVSEEKYRDEEKKHVDEANALRQIVKRLENQVLCGAYLDAEIKLISLAKKITTNQNVLEIEQSAYLEKFFDKINHYFKIFGSRDFVIFRDKDEKGDLPIYVISVKYKGKEVSSNRLGSVFSESDKRALALSIFWASISILDKATLDNTIVVLDDPVTSFDDNRVSSAIKEFRTLAEHLRQMIILSHYVIFAKRYLEHEKVGGNFSLLLLEKDDKSTQIKIGEAKEFLDSEHHKRFENIRKYIARKRAAPIDADLRIYLENEVRSRYRQNIANLSIENAMFSDLIDYLHANDAFWNSEAVSILHKFREDLNVPHHKWSERTPDDWASVAEEMLEFIYTKL
ncbi:MAG: AAA family ATPase [Pseudomonadota bacterium]